jgi:homoserine dehydrogenase
MSAINVAIVGMGTVGSGVAKILLNHPDRIRRRSGRLVRLKHAVVRNLNRSRDVALPEGVLSDDWQQVLNDPEVEVVVHLVGGTDAAYKMMKAFLAAGKHIVTANKALLCQHGPELFALAREKGRTIAFEAAVAGGIPIIATLGQSMSANQITSIEAILNGTSNFILTEMLAKGSPYEEVLQEAQQRGYAEADPSMDVDGTDAAQKLVLLTQLAFGTRVSMEAFPRQGIDSLQLADLNYARELGYTIKLLAVAKLVNRHLEMHVQPTLVRDDRPLAQTEGAFNMIALEGDAVGPTWYAGAGAGQMATASAVVADLIDTITGRAAITFPQLDLWNEGPAMPLQPAEDFTSRYYLRFNVEDRPHVFANIADILGRHQISLASIIQHEAPEPDEQLEVPHPVVPVVVMTHRTKRGQILKAQSELNKLDSLRPPLTVLSVAD